MLFNYDNFTHLEYKVRSLTQQVNLFQSGEKYTKLKAEYEKELRSKDAQIRKLEKELAEAHAQTKEVFDIWTQACEDVHLEAQKELQEKDREINRLKERILELERQRDAAKDKVHDKQIELYAALTKAEELEGQNNKLHAQINRDYTNSSKPSSASPNHGKITNNREKTGRKPGGQPGHEGHGAKRQEPTETILIPAPEEYTCSPEYKPTGRMRTRQLVGIRVELITTEYVTPEFRYLPTGQRVHVPFPGSVPNAVNYDGSVKAFAFLLNNICNVSIDKTRAFISEVTRGKLSLSKGMINGLAQEFSKKTKEEQQELFAELVESPVLHTDFTTARVNGKNMAVHICGTEDGKAMFKAREHKGHKGVEGTPVEYHLGILVHDHELTFYNYGTGHQECLVHVLRYLLDSIENEKERTWSKKMRTLIQEMIHYANHLGDGQEPNPEKVDAYENEYQEILDLAKQEYEDVPPSDYYRDGYNLYLRMQEYKDNHLLFLHNIKVPHDNNLAERLARMIKRKIAQATTMRSYEALEDLCDCLSFIVSYTEAGKNTYQKAAEVFNKQIVA